MDVRRRDNTDCHVAALLAMAKFDATVRVKRADRGVRPYGIGRICGRRRRGKCAAQAAFFEILLK